VRSIRVATLLLACLLVGGCGSSSSPPPARSSHGHAAGKRHSAAGSRTVPSSAEVTNATPQPSWKPYAGQKVPILVYHDLGNPPPGQDYPGLYVSDADFEAEMAWLHSAGYEAVTLDEMMNAFFKHGTLPAKPIVITFDNGYIPQAVFAPSVMSRYGWPGVLNEIIENHLSDARLERLIHLGWEIDSHSLTHPDLTTAGPAELNAEVADSRGFLQRTFHIPSNSFCYPSNRYNAAVVAAVKAAGYTNAVTENPGFATPSTDPFLLPRFEIEGGLSQLQSDLQSG
jgi:hypothetical protein